jgi:predicted RNase H-like HicB family nuclease
MLSMQLTAVFIEVPEGYIAFVEELPGANTQGDTLSEARENLREAVGLVLEANRELAEKTIVGQTVTKEPFELALIVERFLPDFPRQPPPFCGTLEHPVSATEYPNLYERRTPSP